MRLTMRKREAIEGYLCIAPWMIGFLLFCLGPILASFFLSFTSWNILSPPKLVGFGNYIKMFTDDPFFTQALKVTLIYSVSAIPLGMIGTIAVSLLLNKKVKGVALFRTFFYLPSVVSGVGVALLWSWIFNPEFGIINSFLAKLGIQGPGWLQSEQWALPALIFMSLWGVGGGMVIYLAGLQNIPTQLYEAAEIDGANGWIKFWKITIPMLSPTIFFNLISGIIGSLQVFTPAFVMTGGGPNRATYFYVLYLYNKAFDWYQMGYAAALAWILFMIILALTLLVFKSSPAWVYYEGEKRG